MPYTWGRACVYYLNRVYLKRVFIDAPYRSHCHHWSLFTDATPCTVGTSGRGPLCRSAATNARPSMDVLHSIMEQTFLIWPNSSYNPFHLSRVSTPSFRKRTGVAVYMIARCFAACHHTISYHATLAPHRLQSFELAVVCTLYCVPCARVPDRGSFERAQLIMCTVPTTALCVAATPDALYGSRAWPTRCRHHRQPPILRSCFSTSALPQRTSSLPGLKAMGIRTQRLNRHMPEQVAIESQNLLLDYWVYTSRYSRQLEKVR